MWEQSSAMWIDRNFLDSPEHTLLIRELMAAHCLCNASNVLSCDSTTGRIFEENVNSALHWSRVYEWPWCLLNGRLDHDLEVLDAGGGHGVFQHALAKRVKRVYNVDLDQRALDFAKVHPWSVGKIECIHGSILDLPFPDNRFDRVFCVSVLEHMEDWQQGVKELVRVLKPGGRILVSFDVVVGEGKPKGENFYISLEQARYLLKEFGCGLSVQRICAVTLHNVALGCICFWADKKGK